MLWGTAVSVLLFSLHRRMVPENCFFSTSFLLFSQWAYQHYFSWGISKGSLAYILLTLLSASNSEPMGQCEHPTYTIFIAYKFSSQVLLYPIWWAVFC